MRGDLDLTSLETTVKEVLEELGVDFIPQFSTRTGFVIDFAILSVRVALEVDGPHHEASKARKRDAFRDLQLRREGWSVVRLSYKDLQEPGQLRERLAALLGKLDAG